MPARSINISKSLESIPVEREWSIIRGHLTHYLVAYNLGELDDAMPPELELDQHEDWLLGRATQDALEGLRSTRRLADAAVPMEVTRG
jgi:hypothetical protein